MELLVPDAIIYLPACIVIPSVSVTVSFAGTVEPKTINSDEAGDVDPDTASLYV